jgi:uncharacterized protein (DUF58 family)
VRPASRREPHYRLLGGSEIDALQERLARLPWQAPPASRETLGRRGGERRSRVLLPGGEYEESRAYLPGDDPRLLDWRLTARTGDLHTRIYREEHRPHFLALLDLRAGMRYATRGRLKATQALIACAGVAALAAREGAALGALLWAPEPRRLAWTRSLRAFLQAAAGPAPPLAHDPCRPPVHAGISALAAAAVPGCRLLVASDFRDLDERGARLLEELAAEYALQLVRLSDPSERELPSLGWIRLEDPQGLHRRWVDLGDRSARRAYAASMRRQREAVGERLARTHARLIEIDTTDDALAWLGAPA